MDRKFKEVDRLRYLCDTVFSDNEIFLKYDSFFSSIYMNLVHFWLKEAAAPKEFDSLKNFFSSFHRIKILHLFLPFFKAKHMCLVTRVTFVRKYYLVL